MELTNLAIPTNLPDLDSHHFGRLLEPYRRELAVHCYRMLGSTLDSEDMVQETFLRAWRARQTYAGHASLRAWLYRIATNACLDQLKKGPRRAIPRTYQPVSSTADPIPSDVHEPVWLQPYPDSLLPTSAPSDPAALLIKREHITLAFVTALHLLPPRQRAVLILRDVLDWQASEVAALLDMTVPAVKSALHRARATLAAHTPADTPARLDTLQQQQLADYVRAWEQADIDALLKLLTTDATFSMPPIPAWYRGHAEIRALAGQTIFRGPAAGRWHLCPTAANQQPAFGLYRRADDTHYQAYGIQVLTVTASQISDIITFRYPGLFAAFGLPETVPVASP